MSDNSKNGHETIEETTANHPKDMDRRLLLGGLAAATASMAIKAESKPSDKSRTSSDIDRLLKENIENIVVIYAENRSFNNLFGDFPGVKSPLSALPPTAFQQRDRDGSLLPYLPPIWGGLVPDTQIVEHQHFHIGEKDLPRLPNAPFALRTANGDPLPAGVVTRDLVHAFYNNQLQINQGRNDGFVAWGDSGALVMGYYSDMPVNLRLWQIAKEYTLCDNFFMGAFGGSFLNHQYLIAAQPPFYPYANRSPSAGLIAQIEGNDPSGIRLKLKSSTAKTALEGPAYFVDSCLTPDFYAVNTMLPPYAPSLNFDPEHPEKVATQNPLVLVPQHHATIGDRLTQKAINWAWYAGGWDAALKGKEDNSDFPQRPNFQFHHQPFNYFSNFAPDTEQRRLKLRDGGIGDTARSNKFIADIEADRLPQVAFYKPQGNLNMHAGYSDIESGDRHIAKIIEALKASPRWDKMVIILTFDENGGWWDHVAPPKGDRWGPGSRIPALIISPHAKKGTVDHTLYDTGSIIRFLTRRFDLVPLTGIATREQAIKKAGGPPLGDLTQALVFS
ncbi:MAG: acid phosphatase [Zymomonas mobilis subsp. pomaceae]|uniref:acid phosphatase n=1 Tax=Zymomonas mobilis TaxID=542 RepID=UPI0039EA31B7